MSVFPEVSLHAVFPLSSLHSAQWSWVSCLWVLFHVCVFRWVCGENKIDWLKWGLTYCRLLMKIKHQPTKILHKILHKMWSETFWSHRPWQEALEMSSVNNELIPEIRSDKNPPTITGHISNVLNAFWIDHLHWTEYPTLSYDVEEPMVAFRQC